MSALWFPCLHFSMGRLLCPKSCQNKSLWFLVYFGSRKAHTSYNRGNINKLFTPSFYTGINTQCNHLVDTFVWSSGRLFIQRPDKSPSKVTFWQKDCLINPEMLIIYNYNFVVYNRDQPGFLACEVDKCFILETGVISQYCVCRWTSEVCTRRFWLMCVLSAIAAAVVSWSAMHCMIPTVAVPSPHKSDSYLIKMGQVRTHQRNMKCTWQFAYCELK